MNLTKEKKKIVVAYLILIVFLTGMTYLKWKDINRSSFYFSLPEDISFPSVDNHIDDNNKQELINFYLLTKDFYKKNDYTQYTSDVVVFEYPSYFEVVETEKNHTTDIETIFTAYFLEGTAQNCLQLFSVNKDNIYDAVDVLKNHNNYTTSNLKEEKDDDYFLEAIGINDDIVLISFVRIMYNNDKFYVLSFTAPEENMLFNLITADHILSSFSFTIDEINK